jgi:hypothetical protein
VTNSHSTNLKSTAFNRRSLSRAIEFVENRDTCLYCEKGSRLCFDRGMARGIRICCLLISPVALAIISQAVTIISLAHHVTYGHGSNNGYCGCSSHLHLRTMRTDICLDDRIFELRFSPGIFCMLSSKDAD